MTLKKYCGCKVILESPLPTVRWFQVQELQVSWGWHKSSKIFNATKRLRLCRVQMDSYDFITHYNYLYNCHPMNLNMEVGLISSLPLQENRYGTVQQDLSPTLSNTSNRLCKSTLKCYVGVVASFRAVTFLTIKRELTGTRNSSQHPTG